MRLGNIFLIGLLIVAISIGMYSCATAGSHDKAVRALEAYGFTKIDLGDRYFPWFRGSKEDIIAYDAWVTNAAGKRVEVTVYMGWLKDATVRVR